MILEEGFLFLEFVLWQEQLEDGSVSACFFSEVATSPLMVRFVVHSVTGGLKTLSAEGPFGFST